MASGTEGRGERGRRPGDAGLPIIDLLRLWDGAQPVELPDEEPPEGDKVRYASGAWDGILTHHMGPTAEHEEARHVDAVLAALRRAVRSDEDRDALYRALVGEAAASYADPLTEELIRRREFGPEDLRATARWLVATAAHREPLKWGIALLGLAGTPEDVGDLLVLARHDEFTLFAAVAVGNLLEDPTDVWWIMARRVHGWGKVQVFERLCGRVGDRPDIRAWLLRHGCDNAVLPEYLAYTCATSGRLAEALSGGDVDDELLEGGCLIVRALLDGGPAPGIEDYEDGVRAVGSLLGHLETRCDTLSRLELVRAVHDWLESPAPESVIPSPPRSRVTGDACWARREPLGWTVEVRSGVATRCRSILERPEWRERVRTAYGSEDAFRRHLAWVLAPRVGVDLWEAGFARLAVEPLDSHLYWNLLQTGEGDRVRRVLAFAEAHLPLGEVASGPATLLGLGPGFRAHQCLDFLVQEMRREGVFSAPLIAAALRSPVVRNRNMAVTALEHHPVEEWGPSVKIALKRSGDDEPDEALRGRMRALAERVHPR